MSNDSVNRNFDYRWGLVMELYGNRRFQEALEAALDVERKFPDKWGEISLGIACINARMGRIDESMHTLERAMSKGHWWSKNELLQIPALSSLRERPDFGALVEKCVSLQREREASLRPELLIFPPSNTSTLRTAMITLHGRGETAQVCIPYWKPAVSKGVLLAVLGSSEPFRSEGLCWDDHERAQREVANAYTQLRASHGASFDRTIVAGYSQGGELALSLAMIQRFPCAGFIAVSPGPFGKERLDEFTSVLENAAVHGLRGYLFSGDKDPTYSMTKKIHEEMVRMGISCEFSVEAGLGHAYPIDFERKLVSAVKFVLS
jgi:predicted esterase